MSSTLKSVFRRNLWLSLVLWLAVIVAGLGAFETYQASPGSVGVTPSKLPKRGSAELRPRVLMFVHPRCPCTRASLAVLAQVVSRHPQAAVFETHFVRPPGVSPRWEQTALWKAAESIPGMHVLADNDGEQSRQFGAQTSGHVVVFDAHGKLVFSGGITQARGHEGENAGRQALDDLLSARAPPRDTAPVFGCPLLAPTACCPNEVHK